MCEKYGIAVYHCYISRLCNIHQLLTYNHHYIFHEIIIINAKQKFGV